MSSGISRVECSIDGATAIPLQLTSSGDPQTWQTIGSIAAGSHTLAIVCRDAAGNASPPVTSTILVLRSVLRDTSEQSYLTDLIDYICGRFSSAVAGTTPQACMVTPAHLSEALSQPFSALCNTPVQLVNAPINAVRGAIEVLRTFLTPGRKAAIAHWPLDEGAGTTVRDDTGTGSTGTLLGSITWVAGRSGGSAPRFDGRLS